jgi:hypothetical protein
VFIATAFMDIGTMPDIITGAGAGGGPHVKVFSGDRLFFPVGPDTEIMSFFAYDPRFTGGVSVAGIDSFLPHRGGQVLGQVVTGAGPGGLPLVRVFPVEGGATTDFFAYDPSFRGGVNVAAHGLVTAAGTTIVASPAIGGTQVRLFSLTGQQAGAFAAYDPRFLGGVTVGVATTSSSFNGFNETILTGTGRGGGPLVNIWRLINGAPTLQRSFFAFDPAFLGGVFVG